MRPITILAISASIFLAACGSDEKTVVVNPQPQAQPSTTVVTPPAQQPAQGNTVVVPQSGSSTKVCPNNQAVC
jgi:hypothetical protein